VAESLVGVFREQPIWLIIDTTRLGFNHRKLTVSIACRNGLDYEATDLRNLDRVSRLVLGLCLLHVSRISLGSSAVKRGHPGRKRAISTCRAGACRSIWSSTRKPENPLATPV